jgi:hypothetical protein
VVAVVEDLADALPEAVEPRAMRVESPIIARESAR